MGQTAVTLEGHGEAAFWNPAGLATLDESEFGLQNGSLAVGKSYALTAYVHSHGIGVLGGAVYLLNYGDLERTDSTGGTIAQVSPRNLEFLASYATQVGALSIGVNYKLVEFRVECTGDCREFPNGEGVTHGLDVGGQLAVGPEGALRIGVAVRNIGFKLQVNNRDQADPLPAHLVVGALYRLTLRGEVPPGSAPGAEPEGLDVKLAADLDSPVGQLRRFGGPHRRGRRIPAPAARARRVRVRARGPQRAKRRHGHLERSRSAWTSRARSSAVRTSSRRTPRSSRFAWRSSAGPHAAARSGRAPRRRPRDGPGSGRLERRHQALALLGAPAASLVVPGTGQMLAHQDRAVVYIGIEVYGLTRYLQLTLASHEDANRFRDLAFEVARAAFNPTQRDTVFEYFETMQRYVESGAFDRDPGSGFAPEVDTTTYNGSVWLTARRTYWRDPNVPPDPQSLEYARAVQFYDAHAVGPGYLWSWRNAGRGDGRVPRDHPQER